MVVLLDGDRAIFYFGVSRRLIYCVCTILHVELMLLFCLFVAVHAAMSIHVVTSAVGVCYDSDK